MAEFLIDLGVSLFTFFYPIGLVVLVTKILVYSEEDEKIFGFIEPFFLAVVVLLGGIGLGAHLMAWLMSLAA